MRKRSTQGRPRGTGLLSAFTRRSRQPVPDPTVAQAVGQAADQAAERAVGQAAEQGSGQARPTRWVHPAEAETPVIPLEVLAPELAAPAGAGTSRPPAHRPVTLARGRHAQPEGTSGWRPDGPTVDLTAPEIIELPDWTHLPSMEVRVDLTGVERRRARQRTRKALDWHGRFVIVHTGNIGIRQGLEELAGALRRLAEVQPDVLVSFIGNGNRRAALLQATAGLPNVELRDPVPPDQLFAVLLASDLLLVSERSDGADIVPSKLTSYFAAARPVLAVVGEASATAVELQSSGAGVLVDPGDPLGFTAAVALLRSDPAERARLGDAGLRYVAAEAMSRLP